MACSPAGGSEAKKEYSKARRQVVRLLEDVAHLHPVFHMRPHDGAEVRLFFLLDDEDHLPEAGLPGVVQGKVHDDLALVPHGGDLLESAEAAAHAGGHDDERGTFHFVSSE